MYDKIIGGLVDNYSMKETGLSPDGKRRYTVSRNASNETSYTSEISVEQLDNDVFDPEFLCYYAGETDIKESSIDSLTDDVFENFYRPKESYISFENGRVKLDFFKTRDFQIDKHLTVTGSQEHPVMNGIVLDLETSPDFVEAYTAGIECNMTNCRDYYDRVAGLEDDDEIFEIVEQYDEDDFRSEIEDLMEKTIDKVSAGAEVVPKGVYVIRDNKVYYLTAEEYYHIYDSVTNSYVEHANGMYSLIDVPGFFQLDSGLIKNEKQALITKKFLMQSLKSMDLSEKKCLDLTSIMSNPEERTSFISMLLSNNPQVTELFEKEVKNASALKR